MLEIQHMLAVRLWWAWRTNRPRWRPRARGRGTIAAGWWSWHPGLISR